MPIQYYFHRVIKCGLSWMESVQLGLLVREISEGYRLDKNTI